MEEAEEGLQLMQVCSRSSSEQRISTTEMTIKTMSQWMMMIWRIMAWTSTMKKMTLMIMEQWTLTTCKTCHQALSSKEDRLPTWEYLGRDL
jgi:hypothetical protein